MSDSNSPGAFAEKASPSSSQQEQIRALHRMRCRYRMEDGTFADGATLESYLADLARRSGEQKIVEEYEHLSAIPTLSDFPKAMDEIIEHLPRMGVEATDGTLCVNLSMKTIERWKETGELNVFTEALGRLLEHFESARILCWDDNENDPKIVTAMKAFAEGVSNLPNHVFKKITMLSTSANAPDFFEMLLAAQEPVRLLMRYPLPRGNNIEGGQHGALCIQNAEQGMSGTYVNKFREWWDTAERGLPDNPDYIPKPILDDTSRAKQRQGITLQMNQQGNKALDALAVFDRVLKNGRQFSQGAALDELVEYLKQQEKTQCEMATHFQGEIAVGQKRWVEDLQAINQALESFLAQSEKPPAARRL